jgi:hypothetical protein
MKIKDIRVAAEWLQSSSKRRKTGTMNYISKIINKNPK